MTAPETVVRREAETFAELAAAKRKEAAASRRAAVSDPFVIAKESARLRGQAEAYDACARALFGALRSGARPDLPTQRSNP